MAKNNRTTPATPPEAVISIIGVGMTLTGDCETEGALRIEGTVKGNVRAGKAVVVGKEGLVDGNIYTQDAVIAGRVLGSVHAESRLELQSTSHITGEIEALRMQLEEGATLQGQVSVGEPPTKGYEQASPRKEEAEDGTPEGGAGGQRVPGDPTSGGVTHENASMVSASPAITKPSVSSSGIQKPLGPHGTQQHLASPATSSPMPPPATSVTPATAPGTHQRPQATPPSTQGESGANKMPQESPPALPT